MQSEGEQEDGVKIGECVGADSGSDTRKRVHTMHLSVSTETNIKKSEYVQASKIKVNNK